MQPQGQDRTGHVRLNLLTRVSVSLFHSWGHRLYANVHFNSNLFGWRMRQRPQIWSIRTHLKEFLLLFDCLEPEINTPRKNFAEKKVQKYSIFLLYFHLLLRISDLHYSECNFKCPSTDLGPNGRKAKNTVGTGQNNKYYQAE